MESFFSETFGVSSNVFSFVILPSLIFFARICDVSLNTIRIIYVLGGRKMTATILGFIESLIWLLAISQIFENLSNWICYVAYPGGFAMGIYVGMVIEEKIAYGKVIIRIITSHDIDDLKTYLQQNNFRFSVIHSFGSKGEENIVFTVIDREKLNSLISSLRSILPTAFYTVERVNQASDDAIMSSEVPQRNPISWLRSIRRK